mgnify:CR=1 FL=1
MLRIENRLSAHLKSLVSNGTMTWWRGRAILELKILKLMKNWQILIKKIEFWHKKIKKFERKN